MSRCEFQPVPALARLWEGWRPRQKAKAPRRSRPLPQSRSSFYKQHCFLTAQPPGLPSVRVCGQVCGFGGGGGPSLLCDVVALFMPWGGNHPAEASQLDNQATSALSQGTERPRAGDDGWVSLRYPWSPREFLSTGAPPSESGR